MIGAIETPNFDLEFPGIRILSREIETPNFDLEFPGIRILSREIETPNFDLEFQPSVFHDTSCTSHAVIRATKDSQ